MKSSQIGVLHVPLNAVTDDPDDVAAIMAQLGVVVVRAEVLFHAHVIEYQAICTHFEEIERGTQLPRYALELFRDDEGTLKDVKVRRES